MCLRLGDFAGDVGVCAGGYGRFEMALGAACAPGNAANRPPIAGHDGWPPTEHVGQSKAERVECNRIAKAADEAEFLLAESCVGLQRQPRTELRVIAPLGVRIERQVKGEQIDFMPQQQRQALLQPPGDAPVLAAPEQAVVHQNGVGTLGNRRFDQGAARGDTADQLDDLRFALNLKTVRPIIAKPPHGEQVIEVGLDRAPCRH